jgi:deoxyadenosine/deoxycytidine kinase
MYISIAGLIGVGKTTLATRLSEFYKCRVYEEGLSKYLNDFYKDQKQYSFQLQIDLLNRRYVQQQEIVWSGKDAIQDRTIYEDQIFCGLLKHAELMTKRDYDTYMVLFHTIEKTIARPDLIVYLRAEPKQCYERLKARGRECEKEVPLAYLEMLNDEYEKIMSLLSKKMRIVTVDYTQFLETKDVVGLIEHELSNGSK